MFNPPHASDAASSSPTGTTILVCDDTPENVRLLRSFLKQSGYEVLTAENGAKAVETCQNQLPDLIIMDVAMPGMDGFEATREIRRLFPNHWIPLIFLSAHASQDHQTKGLSAGGDDYLTKPINLAILHEKIKAMLRVAESQARVAHYAAQLETHIEEAEEEQDFAKHLMQHLMQNRLTPDDGVWQQIEPAKHFSGDAILSARGPGGELYIMVMDATGHGLAAAISVLPVIEAFYRLVEKGFSINSIVRELNRKIRKILPVDRFIAAAVAIVDLSQRTLSVWNGGLPDVCLLSEDGRVLKRWKSTQPPLGIRPDEELQPEPEWFVWNEAGQLFMHTDGLEEAEDPNGDPLGQQRILEVASVSPASQRLTSIVQAAKHHIGTGQAHDDITVALVDCPLEPRSAVPSRVESHANAEDCASAWRLSIRLEAAQLRSLDIVPMLISALEQLRLDEQYRGIAFMILAELANNALDHGLLHMESSMKHQPDGFERYLAERTKRLANLTSGFIEFTLEQVQMDNIPTLRVSVQDSGEGFQHQEFMHGLSDGNTAPSGRGLALVKSMAGNLSFSSKGNEVTTMLPLYRPAH